jgi:Flp pilus assembly protein TadG
MTERGHAAVELALAVGVLLLPAAIVVAGFGPWSETRVEAEAVAAEAARSAVLSLSHDAGLETVATTTSSMGVNPELVRVGWCGAAPTVDGAGSCLFQRGAVVTATVQIWVPLVNTPWGDVGGLWVSGEHSEPIDLYRSLG